MRRNGAPAARADSPLEWDAFGDGHAPVSDMLRGALTTTDRALRAASRSVLQLVAGTGRARVDLPRESVGGRAEARGRALAQAQDVTVQGTKCELKGDASKGNEQCMLGRAYAFDQARQNAPTSVTGTSSIGLAKLVEYCSRQQTEAACNALETTRVCKWMATDLANGVNTAGRVQASASTNSYGVDADAEIDKVVSEALQEINDVDRATGTAAHTKCVPHPEAVSDVALCPESFMAALATTAAPLWDFVYRGYNGMREEDKDSVFGTCPTGRTLWSEVDRLAKCSGFSDQASCNGSPACTWATSSEYPSGVCFMDASKARSTGAMADDEWLALSANDATCGSLTGNTCEENTVTIAIDPSSVLDLSSTTYAGEAGAANAPPTSLSGVKTVSVRRCLAADGSPAPTPFAASVAGVDSAIFYDGAGCVPNPLALLGSTVMPNTDYGNRVRRMVAASLFCAEASTTECSAHPLCRADGRPVTYAERQERRSSRYFRGLKHYASFSARFAFESEPLPAVLEQLRVRVADFINAQWSSCSKTDLYEPVITAAVPTSTTAEVNTYDSSTFSSTRTDVPVPRYFVVWFKMAVNVTGSSHDLATPAPGSNDRRSGTGFCQQRSSSGDTTVECYDTSKYNSVPYVYCRARMTSDDEEQLEEQLEQLVEQLGLAVFDVDASMSEEYDSLPEVDFFNSVVENENPMCEPAPATIASLMTCEGSTLSVLAQFYRAFQAMNTTPLQLKQGVGNSVGILTSNFDQFALRLSDAERDALFGTCEKRESMELARETTPCRNDGPFPQRFNGTEESCAALGSCKRWFRDRASAFSTSTSTGQSETRTTNYYHVGEAVCMQEAARFEAPGGLGIPGFGYVGTYYCRCEPDFEALKRTSYIGSDALVQQLIDDAEECADLTPQSCQSGQTYAYTVTQSEVSSASSGSQNTGGSTLQTTAPQDTAAPAQEAQAPGTTTPAGVSGQQEASPTVAATTAPATTTPAPTVTEYTVQSTLSVTFDTALSDEQVLGAQRSVAESMGLTFPSPGLDIIFQLAATSARRLLATAYDVTVRYTTRSEDASTAVKARLEDPAASATIGTALQTATGVAVSDVAVRSVNVQQVEVSGQGVLDSAGAAASLAMWAMVACALAAALL
ncbi:unnamed protein product [Pedinophyceae sp. YPF-701]|nr:unnamed protein product [Pedinophyceae sp. YPF-701]